MTDCPGSATIRRQLRRVQKVSPPIFDLVLEGRIPSANLAFTAVGMNSRRQRRFLELMAEGEDAHTALHLARDTDYPGDDLQVPAAGRSTSKVTPTHVPAPEAKAMTWYQESVTLLDSWPRGASLRTLHTLALAFHLLVGDKLKDEQV